MKKQEEATSFYWQEQVFKKSIIKQGWCSEERGESGVWSLNKVINRRYVKIMRRIWGRIL